MSQHDFSSTVNRPIPNGTFPASRANYNSALKALLTSSSGGTAPAYTEAYQLWIETSTGWLWRRNGANSAWDKVYNINYGPVFQGIVNAANYGAKDDNSTDNATFLQNAIDAAPNNTLFLPRNFDGVYRTSKPIFILDDGFTLLGAHTGTGYGSLVETHAIPTFSHGVTIMGIGTGPAEIYTRYTYRDDAGDPQDPPLSTVLNIQNNNVTLRNLCVANNVDYSDPSPTNYGSDWDVGIFLGCRTNLTMDQVFVLGYFREACIWVDATRVNPERAGTAVSATATTIRLESNTPSADDELNNCFVEIQSGLGAGQTRQITDWNGATRTATVPTWTTTPDATSRYRVYGRELGSAAANNARGVNITFPSTPERGADRLTLRNVFCFGGKWALRVQGAEPKPGLNAYGYRYSYGGYADFSANPANGDTIKLAEVTFTFKTTATSATTDVQLGATLGETLVDLVLKTNGLGGQKISAYNNFNKCDYFVDGTRFWVVLKDDKDVPASFPTTETSTAITFNAASLGTLSDPARYFDSSTGVLVRDQRGSFGCSDLAVLDCALYGTEHHSGYRRDDILFPANVATDTAGGAVFLSGLAGNAANAIWGHRFQNCRFASSEPFDVKLGRTARDVFLHCHNDRSGLGRYTTKGILTQGGYTGTAQSGGATTIRLAASAPSNAPGWATDDALNGYWAENTGGTGVLGERRRIMDYAGATNTCTVSPAWTTNPDNTTTYRIYREALDYSYNPYAAIPGQQYIGPYFEGTIANIPSPQYFRKGRAFTLVGAFNNVNEFSGRVTALAAGSIPRYSWGNEWNSQLAEARYYSGSGNLYFSTNGLGESANAQTSTSATTITLAASASATDSFYVGATIRLIEGPGAPHEAVITGYVGATKIATMDTPVHTTPTSGTVYVINRADRDAMILSSNVLSDSTTITLVNAATTGTARITSTGQLTITSGTGELDIQSATATDDVRVRNGTTSRLRIGSNGLRPATDNSISCGTAALRFTFLAAVTATITTSDERTKCDVAAIDDRVLDAWARVEWVQYRQLAKVQAEGDAARIHFGVIAQQVKAAFEAEGLDPFRFALMCHETEVEIHHPTEVDEKGNPVVIATVDRFGVRYDHCQVLEAELQRRERRVLADRLAALETVGAKPARKPRAKKEEG